MIGSAFFLAVAIFAQADEWASVDFCVPTMIEGMDPKEWADTDFPAEDPSGAALQLANCVSEPDPFLRDQIGFTGLSTILRRGDVPPATLRALITNLSAKLDDPDPLGVSRSFSILALSEVARVDRVSTFLDDQEFQELIDLAVGEIHATDDYRAYDEEIGWRHRVAHAADFALQLILNDRIGSAQLENLRQAIATQVAPSVAYTHDEPRRLARPLLYLAYRSEANDIAWEDFVIKLVSTVKEINESSEDLASNLNRNHNLRAFLLELYAASSISGEDQLKALAAASKAGLSAIAQ